MNMTLLIVDWSHVWLVTGVGFIMVFILLVFLTYTLELFGKFMHKLNNKQINNTKKVSEPPMLLPKLMMNKILQQ